MAGGRCPEEYGGARVGSGDSAMTGAKGASNAGDGGRTGSA